MILSWLKYFYVCEYKFYIFIVIDVFEKKILLIFWGKMLEIV